MIYHFVYRIITLIFRNYNGLVHADSYNCSKLQQLEHAQKINSTIYTFIHVSLLEGIISYIVERTTIDSSTR